MTVAPVDPPGLDPATTRRERMLLPVLIYTGLVVSVIGTLGTPLIPTIAHEQDVSLGTAQWLLTVTLLVGAVATPTMGRLGDGPRRRAVILVSLAVVLAGNVLAASASTFPLLITGRAMQGLGLGLMPLAIAVARDHLPPHRLRSAVAILSITSATGAGLGYPLTGLIAQTFDYHAGFWFGAGVTAVALVLAAFVVPNSSHAARHPLDVAGAVLLGASLLTLLLAVSQGEVWGWTSARIVGLFATAAVLGIAWVLWQLRARFPLVELRLIRHRAVLTADVAAVLMGMSMYAMSALVNRYAQTPTSTGYGFGMSIAASGLILVPMSLGSVLSSRAATVVGRRWGTHVVLPIGAFVTAADMAYLAFARSGVWDLCVGTFLLGVGVGTTFAAMPALIISAVPGHETGSATSFNQVLRTIGGSIGSAASITILTAHTAPGDVLPSDRGYSVAFFAGAVVALVAGVLAVALPGRALRAASRAAAGRGDRDLALLMEESGDAAAAGIVLDEELPSVGVNDVRTPS